MKISVITPVYNCESTIELTIKSVLNQKCSSTIEYIIVDGLSSDKTIDVVKKYSSQIYMIISEKDTGVHDAINKGLKFCSGDYVFVVAADDMVLPDAFFNFESSVRPGTEVWCGSIIFWKLPCLRISHSVEDLSLLEKYCTLRHPASFFSRKAYEKYGEYDAGLKCAGDRDLFLRFYRKGAAFQIERIPVVYFEMGGISTAIGKNVAMKEDKIVSIRYGMKEEDAEKIYNENIYGKNNQVSRKKQILLLLLEKIHIFRFLGNLIYPSGNILSKDNIHKYGLADIQNRKLKEAARQVL